MKFESWIVLFTFLFPASFALADYMLPKVEEQLILLVDARDVRLDKQNLILSIDGTSHTFTLNRFWMQDRIWSDGICSEIEESDAKSSASRIRKVQEAIDEETAPQILMELVRVVDTQEFFVSYLQLFDSKAEYKRYYSQKIYRGYPDTIQLPFDPKPENAEALVAGLKQLTTTAQERLRTRE